MFGSHLKVDMRRDVEREYHTPTRCRPVEQPWAYMLQRACVGDIRAARTAARRLARRVESQPVVYEIVRCDVPRINLFCDW